MPGHAPPIADEREGLTAFLRQQQDAFRVVGYGLTDEQAGLSPTPSTLSIGGLIKHATAVQAQWLATATAAPDRPAPDPRTSQERWAAYAAEFTFTAGESLPDLLARFDEVAAQVLAAVGRLDPSTPVPVPPAPWFPKDLDAWSIRWVWFHLIEELARHAGHADIIREAIDGGTLYELMAGYEGWPATDWLTPWTPKQADPA